jgi:hypothetical protein
MPDTVGKNAKLRVRGYMDKEKVRRRGNNIL